MATEPRRRGRLIGWRAARGLALAGVAAVAVDAAPAQPPAALPKGMTSTPVAAPARGAAQVIAYIHGTVPITRDELHDFLIARGGMDKVELLVNRKVIEVEAARRNISVTPQEIEAGVSDDLRGTGISRDELADHLRRKFGKTLFEWEYDVIRPRLLLGKMCQGRVQVADAEVRRLYEHRFGEKREAQVITFPAAAAPTPEVRAAARTDPAKFEALAREQPGPLAAAGGRINPIGRHIEGEDPAVEAALFALKNAGDVSEWVETKPTDKTPGKLTCVRLLRVVPPDPAMTFERCRDGAYKDLYDLKVGAEIEVVCEELKRAADPKLTVHVPVPPAAPVPPGQQPPPPPVRVPSDDPRVLAFIYGKFPITREDLGEFLLLRGGYEKLDLLVNRKIIDHEAARRNLTATPAEIDAALAEYLKGLPPGHDGQPITKDVFVSKILPLSKRSLFEYVEDEIRPTVLLRKMAGDRVKVSDDDLRRLFENRFGEKREAKIVLWPKHELRQAQKQWDEARQGATQAEKDANFDRVARGQNDTNLAAAAGRVAPIGRHTEAESSAFEQVLFGLKEGEVSHLFETPAGIMCVKCVKFIPPAAGVTFEQERPRLEKDAHARKLTKTIPAVFLELREQAKPNVLLKGAPTPRENEEGVRQLIQQIGGLSPAPKK